MEDAGGHGVIISRVGDNAIQGVVDIMAGPRVTAGHREAAGEAGSHKFGWNEEEEEAGGSTDHSHQGHKHPEVSYFISDKTCQRWTDDISNRYNSIDECNLFH